MTMYPRGNKNHQGREQGIALLMCLFALLLLTAIGMGMMYVADSDSQVNQNYRDSQRAYFAAQAGVQEARLRIQAGTIPDVLPGTAATGVYYITNPKQGQAVTPWTFAADSKFPDTELCHENFPAMITLGAVNAGAGTPCSSLPGGNWYTQVASTAPNTGTNAAIDYKWVRITQKMNLSAVTDPAANSLGAVADTTLNSNNVVPICWNGNYQKPAPVGKKCTDRTMAEMMEYVYRVTSLAVTPSGSRRMMQVEVADPPPFVTNAAVDSQDHVTLNGQLTVNGYDYCSCNCVTVKGVTTCTDRAGKNCDKSKYAIYSASTVENPNASETIIAGTTPAIAQNQPWSYNIADLIKQFKDSAADVTKAPYNWTCGAGSYPTQGSCGTKSNAVLGVPPDLDPLDPVTPTRADGKVITPQITYVPGNVQLTAGAMGNGILIVDGDLDIHGGLQFYGLVLVRGVIKFTGGGSDKTNISGAVLAGQESLVDNVLGGSASIQYNVCALTQKFTSNPPKIISAREVMF